MKLSKNIGCIHFIGIGGIGMSGIAMVLHALGYQVQGSDTGSNANTERMIKMGITIFPQHVAENIQAVRLVVFSSAVTEDNIEYQEAVRIGVPVIRRAEMLAELMRFKSGIAIAGTHGKTTTTSIVGSILEGAQYDPTVINGGIINSFGSNTRVGQSEWLVAEADESDGSFTHLPVDIAIVTNIDYEHVDHYPSFEQYKNEYINFIKHIPFYGFAVMCIDHAAVKEIRDKFVNKNIVTYGFSSEANFCIYDLTENLHGLTFSIKRQEKFMEPQIIENIFFPMHGVHNALNATAAIAVALKIGIEGDVIKKALAQFEGVFRRFTYVGSVRGATIYDDYGHHPVEIKAVLEAGRKLIHNTQGRIIAIMQPHRYTRLAGFFDDFARCFDSADSICILPVYNAGEKAIDGYDHRILAQAIKNNGKQDVMAVDSDKDIAPFVLSRLQEDDVIIFLGAGSITKFAYDLPAQLQM